MKIGERIRKFRTEKSLSQKQLAIMSRMSEPAIRNYELGNRYPSMEQIQKIAMALSISPYAIADPDFETTINAMTHALFRIEDNFKLKPKNIDGQYVLKFDINSSMAESVELWCKEIEKLNNGEITQEEYDLWRHSFPRLQVERDEQKRREFRKKNKE